MFRLGTTACVFGSPDGDYANECKCNAIYLSLGHEFDTMCILNYKKFWLF
jgi:hypothetical protein